jgi:hypothetical protein
VKSVGGFLDCAGFERLQVAAIRFVKDGKPARACGVASRERRQRLVPSSEREHLETAFPPDIDWRNSRIIAAMGTR